MDAEQETLANPYGMDTDCRNCPALAESRDRIVHGYGDVGAEFVFVGEMPTSGAEAAGVPFGGDGPDKRVREILQALGFSRSTPDSPQPEVQNCYLTYLTRCRHPDRPPESNEVTNCEPFLNAEIRMINPEIIVPVGQRALQEMAVAYTTRSPDSFDIVAEHATTIRGRGFELVPMLDPAAQDDHSQSAFIDHMRENVLSRDYRQTKGRRSR